MHGRGKKHLAARYRETPERLRRPHERSARYAEGTPEGTHNGFAGVTVFAGFSPCADFQESRLDANLDFVRTKTRDFCVRDEMVAGFHDVELHGL